MEFRDEIFLQILKAALKGEQLPDQENLTLQDWELIARMSHQHQVLPMFYNAIYRQSSLQGAPFLQRCRQNVMPLMMSQTRKTHDFLILYQKLRQAGVTPMVVKGIICRNLYPQPDFRLSSDEDVLIPPEQFSLCHQLLTECGMVTSESPENFEKSYEIPYTKPGGVLYIELHKSLFPPESDAYGDLNSFFENVHHRAEEELIQGVPILSMNPTDHLFYLICHSFKHFLHSGFGIRQVCDIILYANRYGSRIDWDAVLDNCRRIRAEKFAAAMFRMGENYLVFDPRQANYPDSWRGIVVDESLMLADLLQAGVFGDSDMSRKHSSTITLSAVESQKQGKKASGLMRSLFPPAERLEGRYPYLKKHPLLLPVAWTSRILTYSRETAAVGGNNASDSIRIGNERVELLKQYGILD